MTYGYDGSPGIWNASCLQLAIFRDIACDIRVARKSMSKNSDLRMLFCLMTLEHSEYMTGQGRRFNLWVTVPCQVNDASGQMRLK